MNQETDEPAPLTDTSLANGTAGLAYIISLLKNAGLIDMDLPEELKELDEFIVDMALQQIKEDRLDYLYGAMGVVHYFTRPQTATISISISISH
jgi:lantibiotic biosynthesis protein